MTRPFSPPTKLPLLVHPNGGLPRAAGAKTMGESPAPRATEALPTFGNTLRSSLTVISLTPGPQVLPPPLGRDRPERFRAPSRGAESASAVR
jgi:hypothetical protein